MSTVDNLRLAFTEEAKNSALYLIFAEKADSEGKPHAARLFRALAESELIHGRAELQILDDYGSTVDNMQFAIATEEREFQNMYARFLKDARKEGNEEAAELMSKIMKVERAHHDLLQEAMVKLLDAGDVTEGSVFVCRTCGNTVVGAQSEACSICGSGPEMFYEIA